MSHRNAVEISDELPVARRIFKNGVLVARNILVEIAAAKAVNMAPLNDLIEEVIRSLDRNSSALVCMCKTKHVDDYTVAHSLSACILTAAFCLRLGYEEQFVREIAIGALLADVGKLRVSNKILNKPDELTNKELEEVRKHAKYTHALLQKTDCFTENTIRAAIEHHERLDGTGYPYGLFEDDISLGGQITAIVDVYDALTSPRVYKEAQDPSEIFRLMYSWGDSLFKKALLKKFVRMVGLYPVGTLVALSNAKLAVVVEHGEKDILLPVVKTVFDLKKKTLIQDGKKIELEEANAQSGINIIRSLSKDEFYFNPIAALF